MTVEQDWPPQKKAFLQSAGHVLALGGPGSGKTHVALIKARDEIRSARLLPGQRILFLSFARPTVARVLEKAKELITPDDLNLLEVNTYHGFAWSILRSHGYLLNNGKPLQLLPPPEGAARLADRVQAAGEQPAGANGTPKAAWAFCERLAVGRPAAIECTTTTRLFRLDALRAPIGVPGRGRPAHALRIAP